MSVPRRRSDAQLDAVAVARAGRAAPYGSEHRRSVNLAWDSDRRQPKDLRTAVYTVRRAYADEVPSKLHTAGTLADDGTPAMTARAEGYIFGSDGTTDARRPAPGDPPEAVSFYLTPFRATLASMERGDLAARKQAAIVRHVAIGSQGATQAAILEGVPVWCAGSVAELALRAFLANLSDIRIAA